MKITEKITPFRVLWLVIIIILLHDALILGIILVINNNNKINFGNNSNQILLEDLGSAPFFSLPDLKGEKIDSSVFNDKIVLVNFWGTWCKSCIDELPAMDKLYVKYKDKGFELLCIAIEFEKTFEEKIKKVGKKAREMDLKCLVVIGENDVVESFGGKIENFPQTYLLDRKGIIRKTIVGARTEKYWEALVLEALKE